jgi:hypothetical protein
MPIIRQRDLTVNQSIAEIKRHQQVIDTLQESLQLRAHLQEVTEIQYNKLVQLAKEGIEFLLYCQVGDVITPEWIAQRDDLARRAQELIQDAPR